MDPIEQFHAVVADAPSRIAHIRVPEATFEALRREGHIRERKLTMIGSEQPVSIWMTVATPALMVQPDAQVQAAVIVRR